MSFRLCYQDQFVVSPEDVSRLLEMRRIFYEKETERKLSKLTMPMLMEEETVANDSSTVDESFCSSSEKPIRRRDMEWLSIILPFVKKYNPHCGVCASSKNYGRRLDTANSYLLRSYFYCQARDCPFNCIVTVKENGKSLLCSRYSNGHVVDHRNAKRIARPNRSSKKYSRTEIRFNGSKKQRSSKRMVHPVLDQWNISNEFHLEETPRLSLNGRWMNTCSNLLQLSINLRYEINSSSVLPGAIQNISLFPFQITVHTEQSLRFYHSILTNKSTQISQIKTNQNLDTTSQSKLKKFSIFLPHGH